MSTTEMYEELGPPKDMSVTEWNKKRRQEIASGRRAICHRTMVDQVSGCGKIRSAELSRGND
jgi:hypothetical protein